MAIKKLFKRRQGITLSRMRIGRGDDLILLGKGKVDWLRGMQTDAGANLHLLEISEDGMLQLVKRGSQVGDFTSSENHSVEVENLPAFKTLDEFWVGRAKQIRVLATTRDVDTLSILRRATHLMNHGAIDYLFFVEQEEQPRSATIAFLQRKGYSVFGVNGTKVSELTKKDAAEFSCFLAVNDRLTDLFLGKPAAINLFVEDIQRHGIELRGVLHVGAHLGAERDKYRQLNVSPVVFVEANPDLAQTLRQKFREDADVKIVEAAASNSCGAAAFNVTSMDQSSSLLGLKHHSELYPDIAVQKSISVETKMIDQIIHDLGIERERINLLVMDIQGAELLALQGATHQLNFIEAIQLEVNYSELYQGCPLIYDLDKFLYPKGFVRVRTTTPFSPESGDALYVRRPKVTFSKLGSMGRFANQAFQYMFLQSYAEETGYEAFSPPWAGNQIFHVQPGAAPLPHLPFSMAQTDNDARNCHIAGSGTTFPNTDLSGFFQYNMRYYKWRKDKIVAEFQFKNEFEQISNSIKGFFEDKKGPIAAIHLRRGDYGFRYFFIPPNEWYIEWLRKIKRRHEDLVVFIATDDLASVSRDFEEFNVITATDMPLHGNQQHDFFSDFAAMVHADFLATANSTFSFLAALLNTKARTFSRPSLGDRRLVDFDPWSSDPLLRDRFAEREGSEFLSSEVRERIERRRFSNRARRAASKLAKLLRAR